MSCLTDDIEAYLLRRLAPQDTLEVQRADLAERFHCAPSQINYVLITRFTPARGFLVESRRGGGGFIRLSRLSEDACAELGELPDALDQATAEHHIARLAEAGRLSGREAAILRAVVSRTALPLPLPLRDQIRARVLRAGLWAALRERSCDQPLRGDVV